MSDRVEYDVLLVGGSPSNLILAHRLVDLAIESGTAFTFGILEKGKDFGAHIVSGAVSNPRVLKKVFPNLEQSDFPLEGICRDSHFSVLGAQNVWHVPRPLMPEGVKKEGYYILTLSEVVKWLAEKLEEKVSAVDHIHGDLFPAFAAHAVVYEGDRVTGVQVVEQSTGSPDEDNIYGRVVCFGDKGFVSRDLIAKFTLRDNPQKWSVGVKEVWELAEGQSFEGQVWHTMGYPLVDGTFGGGFIYGMKGNKLTVGLIASLDSPNPNLNPQEKLQDLKKHPWLQGMLKGGKLLKYGAALLPEGGYYSLPKQFQVDGALILGDALGVLDVSCLSGVDKSMETGYIAAQVIHDVLKSGGDFTQAALAPYQQQVMDGFIGQELKKGRYFRHAWEENPRLLNAYLPEVLQGIDTSSPYAGLISVGLKNNPITALTDALRLKGFIEGTADIGHLRYKPDYQHIIPNYKPASLTPPQYDEATVVSRPDAVFYADPKYHEGNMHIDEFNADVCVKCISSYEALQKTTPCVSDCTAEVHRVDDLAGVRKHGMSLENCIQCRTCEIVCPEVNLKVRAAEQGSGPDFMGL
ncbi:4Fe-4S dicluster domain-containing protein [Vampirovibrio chlorellavorus]|uniref:4Fe-4S dicluster domain-containing protein n=1 Tax=Vampirovibrio chlorellavorus TaxID=758823 RepID=UPI0026F18B21|nr:4Fe-4S dicluster domain-containing protein [Vampirovibrio chlorellavorus]